MLIVTAGITPLRGGQESVAPERANESATAKQSEVDPVDKKEDQSIKQRYKFWPFRMQIIPEDRPTLAEDYGIATGMVLHMEEYGVGIGIVPGAAFVGTNYFLSLAPGAVSTEVNYGLQISLLNFHQRNYGMSVGVVNGDADMLKVPREGWRGIQIGLVNADGSCQIGGSNLDGNGFQLGIWNKRSTALLQIGMYNCGNGKGFQIGLLNYNPDSLIPWCPLLNFSL